MKKKKYLASVFVLSIGTLLSQAIPIAMSPIYTRIFDPDAFGSFAVYVSIVLALVPLMSGRYELAALSVKNKIQALKLFQVAEIITIIFAIAIGGVVSLMYIADHLLSNSLAEILWTVPMGLLLAGFFNVNLNRLTRLGDFKEASRQKILLEIFVAASTIFIGIAGVSNGMVYGAILGAAILLCQVSAKAGSRYVFGMMRISRNKIEAAKKNISYLKYNATTAVLDSLTVAMPTFYISQIYGTQETGFYYLATKLINAPTSFSSNSIAQVNLKYIAELRNNNLNILPLIVSQSIFLITFGMIIAFFWYFLSKSFVTLVFGLEWVAVSGLIELMVISLPIKFMASTLSTALGATGKNKTAASWRVITFLSMCAILVSMPNSFSFIDFIKILVIFEISAYVFYYGLIIFSVSRIKKGN